ncbi:hypothetical protein B0H13DRAFT_2278089, partial [Mycena leptocephala]
MRTETKVRRRVWIFKAPCYCMRTRAPARTMDVEADTRTRARKVDVEVVLKLLAGVCAPAFLVKRAYRCRETHAHMHTQIGMGLGEDVRARVSVEVGMESAGPGS